VDSIEQVASVMLLGAICTSAWVLMSMFVILLLF